MIDADTGNIHLPNGFIITPALTLDSFRQSWFGREAKPNYVRNERNCWFRLITGVPDVKPTAVGLSFYEQVLTNCSLTVCSPRLLIDSEEAWFESEVQVKAFHDNLLRQELGEPTLVKKDTGSDTPGLEQSVYYEMPWGQVRSTFDYGGGDSYI